MIRVEPTYRGGGGVQGHEARAPRECMNREEFDLTTPHGFMRWFIEPLKLVWLGYGRGFGLE